MAVSNDELLRRIRDLERQIRAMEARGDRVARARYSEDNVSDPPDYDEITAAFGTPASVGASFIGHINDSGAGASEWAVFSDGADWWYVELTIAVVPP